MQRKPHELLDVGGIDLVCDLLLDGNTYIRIAEAYSISRSSLLRWIESDPERSARARIARIKAAAAWDELAEKGIAEATSKFELEKAREIAHHYRWRAKAIAPRDYGDRPVLEETKPGDGDLKIHGGFPVD